MPQQTDLAKIINFKTPSAAPVEAPAPAPAPAKPAALSDNSMLAQAIIGLAPILAGAALRGAEGGAAGARAGLTGLSALETSRKEREAKEEEAKKLAKAEKKEFLFEALALGKAAREEAAAGRAEKQAASKLALEKRGLDIEEKKLALKEGKPAPMTKGQEALDRSFAKEYSDYVAGGGFSSVQKSIKQLEDSINLLEKERPTGPIAGITPFKTLFRPTLVKVKEDIESSVSSSLKQILGAAFTQKEADQYFSRAFNPSLSPEVNIERAKRVLEELKTMAASKEAASQYFEQTGTLTGFPGTKAMAEKSIAPSTRKTVQGPSFGIEQEAVAGPPAKVIQNGIEYTLNPETGKYE